MVSGGNQDLNQTRPSARLSGGGSFRHFSMIHRTHSTWYRHLKRSPLAVRDCFACGGLRARSGGVRRARFQVCLRRETGRSPRVRCCCFLRAVPDLPARVSGESWASPSIAGLPSPRRPSIRFLCLRFDFRLRLSPTPPRGEAVAFGSRFPPPGPQRTFTSSINIMPDRQRRGPDTGMSGPKACGLRVPREARLEPIN